MRTRTPRHRAAALELARFGAAASVTALLAAVGCVPASRYQEPRPLVAAFTTPYVDPTAAALVGDWRGRYDAPFYARRGDLVVSLHRVVRVVDGRPATSVAGTATVSGVSAVVDSAHVARGHVVLWLQPYADPESGATIAVRLDGALAADTLGGRLRADAAATVVPERHGGWRVVRVPPPARPAS